MNRTIVSLIGYGGSGKTTVANYLHEKYGFDIFTFSKIIRDYATEHGINLRQRADFSRLHAEIVKKYGARYLPSLALATQAERICVDNLSTPFYAKILREAGGKGIAFVCPVEIRFSRTRAIHDKAKYPDNIEAFIRNERDDEKVSLGHGLGLETAKLMQNADYHIDATQPLPEVLRKIDEIVNHLIG